MAANSIATSWARSRGYDQQPLSADRSKVNCTALHEDVYYSCGPALFGVGYHDRVTVELVQFEKERKQAPKPPKPRLFVYRGRL